MDHQFIHDAAAVRVTVRQLSDHPGEVHLDLLVERDTDHLTTVFLAEQDPWALRDMAQTLIRAAADLQEAAREIDEREARHDQ